MSSLAKELLVDPWRRLKWGFIPVRREVTDLDAGEAKELVPSEVEKEEGTSLELSGDRTSSADGELTKEEFRETKKNLDTASTDISEYEYKDEANRKWYKFFDEQEYRIKKSQASNNKWYSWFNAGTSTKEKKLLLKLDVLLAFYSCLAYWVKYLDTVNLNNAYVSGMQEELKFKGNDLVHTQVMFTVGNIIFQIPFLFLLNRVPLNYLLPVLDLCWSLLTVGEAYVNNVPHLKAIRFFVGASRHQLIWHINIYLVVSTSMMKWFVVPHFIIWVNT